MILRFIVIMRLLKTWRTKMPNKSYENEIKGLFSTIRGYYRNAYRVDDRKITDTNVRRAMKEKKRRMYHNTQLMLRHYRDIAWMLECFPNDIAEELDMPMMNVDALINVMNTDIGLNNRKLENRMQSVQRTRLLLDRFNEALTFLKNKPINGKFLYEIIYQTYIMTVKLTHIDLIYRLNVSTRHYYRLRQQAINIISLRFWAAPSAELDSWLDVLAILENI
jgi:hypothetical protein